jgi:LPPG:FO 2-phospho-L-lactate transferase
VVPAETVSAVVNVGDDLRAHGLHVSPDIDTVIYTLAGEIDPKRGWGLAGETWQAQEGLGRYGADTWFNLGDRDLATHIHRTRRLAEGAGLAAITAELAEAWGLGVRVLPVTEEPLRTRVTLADGPEVDFQEYFVRLRHEPAIAGVSFDGAERASPGPGVLDVLATADAVIVAPSNPIVSIDPVLAVPGVRDAVEARRTDVVGVSPIVGGAALKGPAADMLAALGLERSALGVARHYGDVIGTLVIDRVDVDLVDPIEALGVDCVVTDTVMADREVSAALARTVMGVTR